MRNHHFFRAREKILAVCCAAFMSIASAEVVPPPGSTDARVRVVNYNPRQVYTIKTFYGVATHIQLSPDETITDFALGDEKAWQSSNRGSNFFIKPAAEYGDTNLIIVTTKRIYHFSLKVAPLDKNDKDAWKDKSLIYSLAFRYPDEERARREAQAALERDKKQRTEVQRELNTTREKKGHNLNYWVAGDEEVSPTGAYDDGTFMYLTFNANRDFPAVYEEDSDGKESLVNVNTISTNTIEVRRMVRSLILRRGDKVARIINKSFDIDAGIDPVTGTVSSRIERVIKEAD